MSVGSTIARAVRPLATTAIGLVIVIAIVTALQPPGIAVLWTFVWLSAAGAMVAGVFLIVRAHRALAGSGAILAAAAIVVGFAWRTSPAGVVWTLALFAGAALIVRGTARDTTAAWWPVALPRIVIGWAFMDNAVNDMVWVAGGNNGFLAAANAAVKREPQFLDGAYQPFIQGLVLPRPDTFAGLFLSGELVFGLLLVLGLFSAIGASGTMWLSANIILEKSFMSHGAYIDKTYLAAELFCLLAAAGFVYGIDAALAPHLPATLRTWLAGAPMSGER